jgi:glycine betaine/proline transport system permease protein
LLWKVQMPIALPEVMLGINQTIMMTLTMLVITALVGTRELGQEVYMALARADTGRGLVAGICVAFIAIIADRPIGAWAKRRKQELGLESSMAANVEAEKNHARAGSFWRIAKSR